MITSRIPNTMAKLILRAPAKINLSLKVYGRRQDGFHEIETFFERIDLADILEFISTPSDISLSSTDSSLSCAEDNLVIKAATILRDTYGGSHGADIKLDKRIPIGAGLGGGSSDAASTLIGLNSLWDLKLSKSDLISLAAQLGSDVPFFINETAFAVARGRGEKCVPFASDIKLNHVLVYPGISLSTKEIYQSSSFSELESLNSPKGEITDLGLTQETLSSRIIKQALCNGSLGELSQGLKNDLEPEAIRRCPSIAAIQSHLLACSCVGVSLSGTGSAVFGLCQSASHAQKTALSLKDTSPSSWRIEVVQTEHGKLF